MAEPRPLVACAALVVLGALPAQAPRPTDDADWAFRPLHAVEPPATADTEWNGDAIDRFVWHALQAVGVQPAPRADRGTLLRRASYVLTGLPPTPDELAAFLADPADDAFARVVDRLLASPHHGEHQARHWLDLARYSDSNGLDENLAFANAYRYRDWVVQAHNQDLPYDRFVQMQIAGDLLATSADGLDGYTATGFLALGPRMLAEQDKEKLVLDTVDEQLDLVGRTVLGLTLGCARCHDHKFDPVTQRDYYALAGVFRSTKAFHDLGHVSKWFDRPLASDADVALRKQAVEARNAADHELKQATHAALATLRDALPAETGRYLLAGFAALDRSRSVPAESTQRTSLHTDRTQWGSNENAVLHTHRQGEQFAEWTFAAPENGPHAILVRYAAAESRPMQVRVDDRVVAEKALSEPTGGWHLQHQRWSLVATCDLQAGEHVLRLQTSLPHVPHLDAWLLVPLAGHEAGLGDRLVARTVAALLDPEPPALLAFVRDLALGDDAGFVARVANAQGKGGFAALLLGGLPPIDRRELAARVQTFVATALAQKPADKQPVPQSWTDAHDALFGPRGLFALPDADLRPALAPERVTEIERLEANLARATAAVPPAPPTVMCVADDSVKDLPVHIRGNHLTLAAQAEPRGVLSVFASLQPPPLMPTDHSGRLELARWLTTLPLTARVQANRIWQRAFGMGLVRSPSNFGRRGDRPVHLALLDALAADLQDHGWSQKRLWRRLLLTRTWQQATAGDARLAVLDPEDRLHGRARRARLQAEALRDAMLATAGTLDRTLGGTLLGTGDRGYVTNDQSADAARYDAPRRSLYLPIIRNAMFELFAAFDYADPSVHIEQRAQSAVAPQALYLLNAPFVRQQSQALVARMPQGDDDARIDWLWQQVLLRAPNATERGAAHAWLRTCRTGGKPEEALPGLAHALFASNEFLYVD